MRIRVRAPLLVWCAIGPWLIVCAIVAGAQPFDGLNFSPYLSGQNPNRGVVIAAEQIRNRLKPVAPHTLWVRTFASTHGLEHAPAIARGLGLKTAVGVWIGTNRDANAREIANLSKLYRAGLVDLAIVGSEAILRGDATAADIVNYLNVVRRENPGIVLGYADIHSKILAHSSIVAASDVVLANIYPYWEGVPVNAAVKALAGHHASLIAAFPGKRVIISETGWPSGGNPVGQAIPSPQNQAFYLREFVLWARKNNVSYFLFASFDEKWKAEYEGPQGAAWGIWDENGQIKPHLRGLLTPALFSK